MSLDINLLGKAVKCHGSDLIEKLREEQQMSVSTSDLLPFLDRRRPVDTDEKNESFQEAVRSFIARKSDMIFKPFDNSDDQSGIKEDDREEVPDVFAIMPPLESFMNIPSSLRREHFFNSVSRDNCVTGVVTSVLDSGLLVRLLCVDVGPPRDLDNLDIMAYCPGKELPRLYAKESALDAFKENDIVRGIILSINAETERIILSLHEKAIPDVKTYPRIGLITEEEFPVHYRRKSEAKSKVYEDILESVMGFNNVGNVSFLVKEQGFSEIQSFTRSLSRLKIPPMEYAEGLNKWQSQKMAHQSVARGVGMFKEGKYMEAMQHFNKALQIDDENVEALVARGALFANKESFQKAVSDFRKALSVNPTHANARSYLIETLLTMGKMLEDERRLEEACEHYEQALEIDPDHTEAKDILEVCQKIMAFQSYSGKGKSDGGKNSRTGSSGSGSDRDPSPRKRKKSGKADSSPTILSKSTEKLLQLIKEDESRKGRSKKKRKHRKSSDRSSSERDQPKKKQKRSSRGQPESPKGSPVGRKGKWSPSPPESSPMDGVKVKMRDVPRSSQDASFLTARSQSPAHEAEMSIATSFLPFSSQRFFGQSAAIPGLGSPPPTANPEQEGEKDRKAFLGSDLGRRSREDEYSLEGREKSRERYAKKSPSSSSRRQGRRRMSRSYASSRSQSSSSSGSSSYSSSSSSSSRSPDRDRWRSGASGRQTGQGVWARGRKKRSQSSRSWTRSRSRSPYSSQARRGNLQQPEKEKGATKQRTGVAELDMYLGDSSSGKTILDLLGFKGKPSPRRSPPASRRSERTTSRSPPTLTLGRRRLSGSPQVRHKSGRSTSKSSDGRRRKRQRSESPDTPPRRKRLQPLRSAEDIENEIKKRVLEKLREKEYVERERDSKERKSWEDGRKDSEASKGDRRKREEASDSDADTHRKDGGREKFIIKEYVEKYTGLTADGAKNKYYATKGKRLPVGYHEDRFGSTYFVGPHPETGKVGSSQDVPREITNMSAKGARSLHTRTQTGQEGPSRRGTGGLDGQEKADYETERDRLTRGRDSIGSWGSSKFSRRDRDESTQRGGGGGGGPDSSYGNKEVDVDPKENPKSRPSLHPLRKPAMDDPGLLREMISSKEFDALERLKKQQDQDKKVKLTSEKPGQSSMAMGEDEANEAKKRSAEEPHSKSKKGKRKRKKRRKHEFRDTGGDKREEDRKDPGDGSKKRNSESERKDQQIVMAADDLEKEIERRVLERLKDAERRAKEEEGDDRRDGKGPGDRLDERKRENSNPDGEGRDARKERLDERRKEGTDDANYYEEKTGWTMDGIGSRYFAIKGRSLRPGYYKDKFGKTYFVGPHPKTGKCGESQCKGGETDVVKRKAAYPGLEPQTINARLSMIADAKEGRGNSRKSNPSFGSSSGSRWDRPSPKRESELGRQSLSGTFEKPGSSKSRDFDNGSLQRDQSTGVSERGPPLAMRKPESQSQSSVDDDGKFEASAKWRVLPPADGRLKSPPQVGKGETRWHEEDEKGRDVGPSAKKDFSRWDSVEDSSGEKFSENQEAKEQRRSSESLTDLESFLTNLKQMKKQQWIAEGKIREQK